MKLVTLTTSHNRVRLTLRALSSLFSQQLPDSFEVSHYLVDDNSTDGTSEAITKLYPSVNIIKGNGNLFWAGGMRYGWDNVICHLDYDYLFVYNDDVILFPDAFKQLFETSRSLRYSAVPNEHVISGSFLDSTGQF